MKAQPPAQYAPNSHAKLNTSNCEVINHNYYYRRFSAFTLIELLTVIAIIGILAAIIIPTVGKVRQTARSAQCVSNLRQIQQASIIYAAENKGLYLPYVAAFTRDDGSSYNYNWYANPDFHKIVSKGKIAGFADDTLPQALMCPLANKALGSGGLATNIGKSGGYGVAVDKPYPGTSVRPRAPNQADVPNPSRSIAFTDAVDIGIVYSKIDSYTYENNPSTEEGTQNAIAFRHNTKANVVFYDGHVKSMTKKQIKDAPTILTIDGSTPSS